MSSNDFPDTTRSTTGSVAATVKDTAAETFAEVKDRATDAASRTFGAARAEAMDRAEGVKESLLSEGERLAQTLRGSMGSEDSIQGRVLGVVADSVTDLSRSLRGRSLGDLMGEANAFARRNPGAFVAGAAIAGFALARFARASTPSLTSQYATGDDDMAAYGEGGQYGSPKPEGMGYGAYGSTMGAGTGAASYGSSVSTSSMTTHDDDTELGLSGGLGGDLGGDIGGGFGSSSVEAVPDADEDDAFERART